MSKECIHPENLREPYHDNSVVCKACNCVIEQHGKTLKEPSFLGAVKFPTPDSEQNYWFEDSLGHRFLITSKPVEPLYTIEAVIKNLEAKGLSVYNSGKDHPDIEFWPSTETIIKLLTENID
jgi:hypothetical protein